MHRDIRIGLIARMDRTGLGQGQTKRLARMLNPDYLMLINSTTFNHNDQHPEWYTGYDKLVIDGFPTNIQIENFLEMVDVVVTCETFYSYQFTRIAKAKKKKTILIANYEFFDWFRPGMELIPKPDKLVMPSWWHFEEMAKQYAAVYIPTPIHEDEFLMTKQYNLNRTGKKRYLFVNGRQAVHDRNGLKTLYDSLKYSKADFELVIKAQGEIPLTDDKRVIYDLYDHPDQSDIYYDFDALIMPRRYAGQCLPMTEALNCAMPVVMTDIDPNNKILPPEWLIPAQKVGDFMTRRTIDIYAGDNTKLGNLLDNLDVSKDAKLKALDIGSKFLAHNLKEDYKELLESWK